jgi:hypothetical protein
MGQLCLRWGGKGGRVGRMGRVLIEAVIFTVVVLMLLRLYLTFAPFEKSINWMFHWFERQYQQRKLTTYVLLAMAVTLGMAIISGLLGQNGIIAWLIFSFLTVPAIPLIYRYTKRHERTALQMVKERLVEGLMAEREVFELKQALKGYYRKLQRPKEKASGLPTWVEKVLTGLLIMVMPKAWPRLIIPKITAIPWFNSWFYESAFHARFTRYHQIYHEVFDETLTHPYRLRSFQMTVDDVFMMIELPQSHKHDLMRLTSLARKLEDQFAIAKGDINVAENDGNIRLLIPRESVDLF